MKTVLSGKAARLADLESLPNIGRVTSRELYALGVRSAAELKARDPEELFERLKKKRGGKLDRCVLYQFRGAVSGKPWPECKD